MKDFIIVIGSLIDSFLGYLLEIMFAISFFIKDVSRRLEALKELEKILEKMEEESVLDEEN